MPDDDTEGVNEHSHRLQPSSNLHATVTAFLFRCSDPDVLPQRDESSGMPCIQSIEFQSGLELVNSGSAVQRSNHYSTAAHVKDVCNVGDSCQRLENY